MWLALACVCARACLVLREALDVDTLLRVLVEVQPLLDVSAQQVPHLLVVDLQVRRLEGD